MNLPKSICVVGGGTAGFVAALIVKKAYPSIDIQISESSKIGTIGVGEGSTEHWKEFVDYMGFNKAEMLVKSDATFKAGIMFKPRPFTPIIEAITTIAKAIIMVWFTPAKTVGKASGI